MKNAPTAFNTPFRILAITLLLAAIGLVMVYSASATEAAKKRRRAIARTQGVEALADDHSYHDARFLAKQAFWLAFGLGAMFLAYRTDYRVLKDWGPYLLGISFFLLLLVFVPGIRKVINGHHRWIGIGPMSFQPSELAKIALIVYMARMLTDHHDKIRSLLHGVLPALGVTSVFALVIIVEPDIGAAAVITAVVFLMWFIGGMRILHLAGLVLALLPAFGAALFMFRDRIERLTAFVFPTAETAMGKGYQLMQSLIAVGSGGATGVGMGNSMQKYFLTEQFSDFIFAILCEELGLVGSILVVALFFLLLWEGWRIALRAPDFYGTLLASGITLMLSVSIALNLMVVLGLAPTKGLALPLVSYGGSNLVTTLFSIGILMNIGKYVERQREIVPSLRAGGGETRGDRGRRGMLRRRKTRATVFGM
ncbi:cell division protein FtsW [Candidatus Sumerlaeota bacterium]|nr:cell division protein FtsW [Candidatus Sumerlaeota bacterium]